MNMRRIEAAQVRPQRPEKICLIETTTVAGTRHVRDVRQRAEALGPGASLLFSRDGANPHDVFAVQVLDERGGFLGYLSCEFNEIVSRLMDGGRSVSGIVRSVGQVGSWTKVEMAVMLND